MSLRVWRSPVRGRGASWRSAEAAPAHQRRRLARPRPTHAARRHGDPQSACCQRLRRSHAPQPTFVTFERPSSRNVKSVASTGTGDPNALKSKFPAGEWSTSSSPACAPSTDENIASHWKLKAKTAVTLRARVAGSRKKTGATREVTGRTMPRMLSAAFGGGSGPEREGGRRDCAIGTPGWAGNR